MSTQVGLDLLMRAAEARGKILRVEGDRPGTTVGVLVLTFDVGRVVLTSEGDGIAISGASEREALPAGIGGLEEEEPWWRLLGAPLSAAWPGGVEDGVGAQGLANLMVLKLRFREEGDNPRIVQLESTGNSMRVTLEPI